MPKKANPESQVEQSARFRKDARKLVRDGELSIADANTALDALVRRSAKGRDSPSIHREGDTVEP